MATIHEASPPSATLTFKTKIPAAYYLHVQRFLWPYYLLTTLYQKFHNCAMVSRILTTAAAGFLQRMQVMLDIVIEQLVMGCVALGENITPDTRIPYFNYYLVTEFVVGRHDPTSVDAWRRNPENKDLDLERIHPDTLDWAAYDAALGKHLGGAYYKYSLANVGVRASWIQLLDALGQWYCMTMRVIPKTQRKAVAPSAEPAKLVHGMAGLGYQLCKDVDEDRDAEGGKGKEKEKDKDKEQERRERRERRRERRERRREKEEDKERRRLKADAQPTERKPTAGDTETQKRERREKKKERRKAEERHRMEAEAEADAQAAADAAAESKEESGQGMDVADVHAVSEDLVDRECDVTMQDTSYLTPPPPNQAVLRVGKAPTPVPLEGDVAMSDIPTPASLMPDQATKIVLTPAQSKSTTPITPPLTCQRGVSLDPLDFSTSLDHMNFG
ncbi:hypothetical protein PAXRUDRAFT_21195 [Paxillus rubicundulus Ve08.2h10]|uniref:Uncharacterized protein n=1 Tax=Paxillus rubicundulus Ve08.2h10 TaxID=930991 RepID=A0A0D0CQP0_9AGAM|nr:hypothetical protein PAXRUDRAFT_21195 [Paxillus rubicundulus Ve08.2h10]